MLRQYFIALVLTILAVSALPTRNQTNPIDPPTSSSWTDIIQGSFSPRSVLVHSVLFTGIDFSWRGNNMITAFEVIERGNETLSNVSIRGGLNTDYLQLWSHVGPVNAWVNIFSEPQDFSYGLNTSNVVLLNSTRLTGQSTVDLTITSSSIIDVVELIDQTNGTGVFVNHIQGIGTRSLFVQLRTRLFQGRIDYNVNIYGAQSNSSNGPNNFEYGVPTNTSVHIVSKTISTEDLFFGWFSFPITNFTFDHLRLSDLTNGTGGRVLFANTNYNNLEILFEHSKEVRFQLDVYGQIRPNNTDLIIGELHDNSVLLSALTLWEFGTEATFTRDFGFPIDRIEVLDQQHLRNVYVTLVEGEIGGRHIDLRFDATQPTVIHYVIRIFGRVPFGENLL